MIEMPELTVLTPFMLKIASRMAFSNPRVSYLSVFKSITKTGTEYALTNMLNKSGKSIKVKRGI
jgi:predicted XRE-type DNA-binding protein